ncbi:hypothetical protein AGABI1DRAFT_113186 [Agaricus bisporus var. burnettii JB137-S8]|uniref:Acyl-protein thioesterase 1 n=2 Tax=Agaricus bisporus var. burnettii TaxID=192524 RepID=K5XA49_AGABU|nr:uncharacterized protein AGABI1DRAFT_113186 [Agaricus bisporus var. burnettii JB137-S8]EKM79942.1 hypothetical protein AGABI1DRAFT_113186 [Agaricus bisporus var. burnettii JB137-S8]KAF7775775.1 hypothetical protein Agabi119p4_4168 [Agaricus bisporus var. burnettii]
MSAIPALRFLTIPALSKHSATVIFIHGLGDTGHGWQPVADMIRKDPALAHVKWILPHSPTRPVTANLGMEMPSWFDIYSFGFQTTEDEKGMIESKKLIEQVVTDEVNSGTPSERIFLGGFSQGGTMSLLVGLTGERKFAALAILSSWLPLRKKFKTMVAPHASSTAIFWGYGSDDSLIGADLTKQSLEVLESSGIPRAQEPGVPGLTVQRYERMGHETNLKELDDLKQFIKKWIPDNA